MLENRGRTVSAYTLIPLQSLEALQTAARCHKVLWHPSVICWRLSSLLTPPIVHGLPVVPAQLLRQSIVGGEDTLRTVRPDLIIQAAVALWEVNDILQSDSSGPFVNLRRKYCSAIKHATLCSQ